MPRTKKYLNDEKIEINEDTEYSPAEVEKNGPETKNGIVTNTLHVKARRGPSSESEVVEILRKGDRVAIIGKVDGYYKVRTSVNYPVYISSDFITEE